MFLHSILMVIKDFNYLKTANLIKKAQCIEYFIGRKCDSQTQRNYQKVNVDKNEMERLV